MGKHQQTRQQQLFVAPRSGQSRTDSRSIADLTRYLQPADSIRRSSVAVNASMLTVVEITIAIGVPGHVAALVVVDLCGSLLGQLVDFVVLTRISQMTLAFLCIAPRVCAVE